MSEAPLAPICRHCGATNDSGASECWLCQRRDWRGDPKPRARPRTDHDQRSTYLGCMFSITITLIAIVVLAFRAGWIIFVAVSILSALIFAVSIALFTICTSLTF